MMAMTQELETALRAWRDAKWLHMSTKYGDEREATCWYALNDAADALFLLVVDAMDASAAQPEHTP